jgi:predicted DNA-binding transcriptional regulator AlpA
VSYLKPSEVIAKGLVAMSQATLYRAVEDARFYCVTPRGKAIGRAFPAWQFSLPVPELLAAVLRQMTDLPSSEIHAFWVTPVDAFDDLTPAEVLAGKPFESRAALTAAQRDHLAQSASERQGRVIAQLAVLPSRSSDLIS